MLDVALTTHLLSVPSTKLILPHLLVPSTKGHNSPASTETCAWNKQRQNKFSPFLMQIDELFMDYKSEHQAWELSKEKTSETRGVRGHAPPEFYSPLHSNLCNLEAFDSIKSGCSKEKSQTFKDFFIISIFIYFFIS